MADLRVYAQQNGKCVRQNTTHNFSTKDKPGTLPINFYESAAPNQSTNPQNRDNEASDPTCKVAISHSTYVLVSQKYRPNSMPVSPLYFAKLLEDVTEDNQSTCYVKAIWFTQDFIDPLLFIITGEEFPVPKLGIKTIVRSIKAVEDNTIEIGDMKIEM